METCTVLHSCTARILYQMGLFWETDHVVLPRSYDMACNRLINIERIIKRNGQFTQECSRIMLSREILGVWNETKSLRTAIRLDSTFWSG